ncbi:poly-gamma-glutamate hydrolase family protein [Methyloversatilis thermotolerans]|uniref:poly-gamma-glutamate hydrolase family protein n=1 Tax=Methyloversatilis thermotolerans TaxID=1346290 RepID=UPI00036381E1|nr:poly-gamma-glutamate hydrolase family protein [Methyloversatilis thermotolerans]
MHRDRFASYSQLASVYREGRDYRITVLRRGSGVGVLAPHGGHIERGCSEVARAIAGDEFDLYLFEGLLPSHNFEQLHITSSRFDEPRAIGLLAECEQVLIVHGVADAGTRALIGGRDRRLACTLADALYVRGVPAWTSAHRYAGLSAANLCNRGRRGAGLQLELSDRLRGGPLQSAVVAAARRVLAQAGR